MKEICKVWEELLRDFPVEFLEFFFPETENFIGPVKKIKQVDWKFWQIGGSRSTCSNILLKNSEPLEDREIIHLHIETGQRAESVVEADLSLNSMRIYESFGVFPLAFALFTSGKEEYRIGTIEAERTEKRFKGESFYSYVYINDLMEKSEDIMYRRNPFAFVTMVQLEFNALRRKKRYPEAGDKLHYNLKKRLLRDLMVLEPESRYLGGLFAFLDSLLPLPGHLEGKLFEEFDR